MGRLPGNRALRLAWPDPDAESRAGSPGVASRAAPPAVSQVQAGWERCRSGKGTFPRLRWHQKLGRPASQTIKPIRVFG